MTAAQIFNLQGKVALVTGASSGLGTRFAEVLAENGASVVLVARRAERLAALQAQIEKSGGKAIAVEADVRDVYWFAGNAFIARTNPQDVVTWKAAPGSYELTALDDHGRAGASNVTVR